MLDTVNKVYKEAQEIAMRFKLNQPGLPSLPSVNRDPILGLKEIQSWCLEANKLWRDDF